MKDILTLNVILTLNEQETINPIRIHKSRTVADIYEEVEKWLLQEVHYIPDT
jgi:hypothetical protein